MKRCEGYSLFAVHDFSGDPPPDGIERHELIAQFREGKLQEGSAAPV